MSNITYRRGQAEWALWQVFRLGSGARETMPPAFSARIKKLLDLDRDQSGVKLAIAGRAFSDADKRRSGRDAEFDSFDVFCLALALDLLDAGFQQIDAVNLIRSARDKLRAEFNRISALYPASTRGRHLAKHHPRLPAFVERGARIADTKVYLITRKFELAETRPLLAKQRDALIKEPAFARGREALQQHMMSLSPFSRSLLVVEFAHTAKLIEGFLARAPIVNRARKS